MESLLLSGDCEIQAIDQHASEVGLDLILTSAYPTPATLASRGPVGGHQFEFNGRLTARSSVERRGSACVGRADLARGPASHKDRLHSVAVLWIYSANLWIFKRL